MKIDRMIGILAILLQKEKVTAPYLAQTFEVSRRTINRDIEALCMAGIPLVTEQGAKGGVSIMEGYKMDRTLLSASDLQAILAGLRSLDSVSGTNRYLQLMEKLSAGTSSLPAGEQHMLIDLSSWQKESLTPKIEKVQEAISSGRLISFQYYAPKGESERTVEPYDLLFQWSSWYLWGFCRQRQEFRLFKLTRMAGLTAGEAFEKRPVPAPNLSMEQVFPTVYQVKAKIHKKFKWKLVEEFGADSFVEGQDGSLLITAGFTDKYNIICWIVSFGVDAELLEPVWLRKELAAFAEEIRQKYLKS